MKMATIPVIPKSLGRAEISSPLREAIAFTSEDTRVLRDIEKTESDGVVETSPQPPDEPLCFEKAGPRAKIYFDPQRTTIGIVSAGGLCPGINDVIRSIVLELRYAYGVERILGFRFGFAGLDDADNSDPAAKIAPILLTPDVVRDIHTRAGSILGTSRGQHDARAMRDTLDRHNVDMLLTIGGDGTMRATNALGSVQSQSQSQSQSESQSQSGSRRRPIGFVGIPKTIDNDIPFVDKTFGFDSAVAVARLAIDAAHAEARSVARGIGLVKLMGRNAGFVAARASLASRDVNACLVPEVPFDVDRVLSWLEERLARRGHAVLVVGEGCADQITELRERAQAAVDSSGNRRYGVSSGADVGRYLQLRIEEHFRKRGQSPVTLKYVDPSYMLRGTRSTSEDAVFCDALARNAVHAAMAGKTGMMVGRLHRAFIHVPLELVLSAGSKRIDPKGELWRDVLETTGQPSFVGVG
jgi:6-phosphofructokinase 1